MRKINIRVFSLPETPFIHKDFFIEKGYKIISSEVSGINDDSFYPNTDICVLLFDNSFHDKFCKLSRALTKGNIPLILVLRSDKQIDQAAHIEYSALLLDSDSPFSFLSLTETLLCQKENREKYPWSEKMENSELLGNMTSGISINSIISDNTGKPSDYKSIYMNTAFMNLANITNHNGEMIHGSNTDLDLVEDIINQYHDITENGSIIEKEIFYSSTLKWIKIRIYSSFQGLFVIQLDDITEKKGKEQKIESIFRAAPVGIGLIKDHVIVEVNDMICSITGYSESELKGKNARFLYKNNSDFRKISELKNNKLNSGEAKTIETLWVTNEGSERHILFSATFFNRINSKDGFTFTILDITAQKEALRNLRESEMRFRYFFQNNSAVMLMIDPESGYILDANNSATKFYRYDHDKLKTMNINEIASIDRRELECQRELVVEGKKNYFVFPHRTADGTEKNVEIHSCPIEIKGKKTIFSIIHDISEKEMIRQELENREKNFRAISERSPYGIAVIDGHICIYANPAVSLITGLPEHLTENESIFRIFSSEDFNEIFNICDTGKSMEIKLSTESGKWVSIQAGRISYHNKTCLLITFSDITKLKETEASLTRSNHKLNKAIAIARDMANEAQAAADTRSHFMANMSHEIRTPLNGVIGIVSLLHKTELSAEQRKYIDIMESSGKTLLDLVNQILDLSKIESGNISLKPKAFSLSKTIDDISDSITFSENVKITTEIDSSIPEKIIGDELRLKQVITNLISNAVKFTRNGRIWIRVKKLSKPGSYIYIHFEVEDTGIGIREKDQEIIFEPFTQVDSSFSREYQGTGLGLSISKRIVNLMGGDMGLESIPGKGSKFWFTVKFSPQILNNEHISGRHKEDIEGDCRNLSDFRVLIVEDNEVNKKVINSMIKKTGLNYTNACDGYECLSILKRNHLKFDLILMDCQMPGMDGFETTREIREKSDDQYRSIPIIAVTAHAMPEDRDRCISAGMNDYLSKPVDMKKLKITLYKWLPLDNNQQK